MDFIKKNAIFPGMKSRTGDGILRELADNMSSCTEDISSNDIYDLLQKRESLCSTAIDGGLAIPHAKTNLVKGICGVLATSRDGIDFGSPDGKLTKIFFVLLSPENSTGDHLRALSQISRLFKDPSVREKIISMKTSEEIWQFLNSSN
ncbi:MAG: PTS sugar transporter subunit IIA [Deltaproteobacteria bacterium]|nr:PTS sugar transporter subunit IIA [Deltaproteobacteria bacterium]